MCTYRLVVHDRLPSRICRCQPLWDPVCCEYVSSPLWCYQSALELLLVNVQCSEWCVGSVFDEECSEVWYTLWFVRLREPIETWTRIVLLGYPQVCSCVSADWKQYAAPVAVIWVPVWTNDNLRSYIDLTHWSSEVPRKVPCWICVGCMKHLHVGVYVQYGSQMWVHIRLSFVDTSAMCIISWLSTRWI